MARGSMLLKAAATLEATAALLLAWMLVFVMPSGWARRLFVPPPAGRPEARPPPAGRGRPRHGRRPPRRPPVRPHAVPDHLPGPAIAGALVLRRRGLRDVTIRFGVRRTGGRLEAHAWLIHRGVVLLGGQDLDSYTPLADLPVGRAAAPDRAPLSVPPGTRS